MENRNSVKLVSLFLILSICLLGYVSMSNFARGDLVGANGYLTIDKDIPLRQGNGSNYTFVADATITYLGIGYDYVRVNSVIFKSAPSIGNITGVLKTWDPTGSIEWNVSSTNASMELSYTIYGLNQWSKYDFYRDSIWIETLTTDVDGTFTFNASGSWSIHEFELVYFGPTIAERMGETMANLLTTMFLLGIVIATVASATKSFRRPNVSQTRITKDMIQLAIYVTVALVMFGIIHAVMFG